MLSAPKNPIENVTCAPAQARTGSLVNHEGDLHQSRLLLGWRSVDKDVDKNVDNTVFSISTAAEARHLVVNFPPSLVQNITKSTIRTMRFQRRPKRTPREAGRSFNTDRKEVYMTN